MNIDWITPESPDKTIYQLILENLSKETQPFAGRFIVKEIQRLPKEFANKPDERKQLVNLFKGKFEKSGKTLAHTKLANLLMSIGENQKSLPMADNNILAFSDDLLALFDRISPPEHYIVPTDIQFEVSNENGRVLIAPNTDDAYPDCNNDFPPATAVVCAIIDEGIPILHERFRRADGKTRILSAYYIDGSTAVTPNFVGATISKNDIDAELVKMAKGNTDETAAYKRLGLLDMSPEKPHDLARHSTHGSVIADLAAGYNRVGSHENDLDRLPILAVNLPSRELIGLAGANLEDAVKLGLEWIVSTTKALFNSSPNDQTAQPWPIVICLAYGQPAGPKDGTRPLEKHIDEIVKKGETTGNSNIHMFMPAGNSNLDRGHAELTTDGTVQHLPLRLPPQDQTPTIVELWTDVLPKNEDSGPPSIEILAPGENNSVFNVPTGPADGTIDGGKAGLIFYRRVVNDDGMRHRYVIALRPTESLKKGVKDLPPSGLWTIALKWKNGQKIYADVQVDLPVNATNATARKAYFDDPAHQRYDNYVRLIDVGDVRSNPAEGAIVTQFGSHNALATGQSIHVIGGYTASDFRPAHYSSTYFKVPNSKPLAALPSEAGPATFGIIGAGVASAASQRLNGTSVATALAARKAVEYLLANPANLVKTAIISDALVNEVAHSRHPGQSTSVVGQKIGAGRVQAPETGRVSRFAPDSDVSSRFIKSPTDPA